MNNFYLYKFEFKERQKIVSATVIFCDREDINEDNLQAEIRRFYEEHYQTDKIFVIGPEFMKNKLEDVFIKKLDSTFKGIPKRHETLLSESLHIINFDKTGKLSCDKNLPENFVKLYLNEGLQHIFIKRGGLVTAQGAHHFVFPSGKHCDKFLRTGNILLFSTEIYFIAFALLKHFNEEVHTQIYCDTSSINSIAFALIDLKNRFLNEKERKHVPIESFSSYDGLYKNPVPYSTNALLLISASTSANIIGYILDLHKMIDRDNIIILYFLGEDTNLHSLKDQLICNLNFTDDNLNGLQVYKTYKEDNCTLCKKGSYPVKVSGDVFLLEKPHINRILLTTRDPEGYLSDFVKQFLSSEGGENVLKVNFKETSGFKYEIYIDFTVILKGLNIHDRYKEFRTKLHDYINQYIPSNTRYIVTLNDDGSIDLGKYIFDRIANNYGEKVPKLLLQDDLDMLEPEIEGSVVIVGSCISNGKNLLYISRALRKHDKLKIVYFIGISRTKNIKYLSRLKNDLKQGRYGAETNSFHEVQTIYCNNASKNTSWLEELNFIRKFIPFIKQRKPTYVAIIVYLEKREKLLLSSQGNEMKGLSNGLFYPSIVTDKYPELALRKNFAFFKFDGYVDNVSQADVYFTINNMINSLRNRELYTGKDGKPVNTLQQSAFVRNLLDPGNFDRFNDGVIQACLLRSACSEELIYRIDDDMSQEIFGTLETLVKYNHQEQGEALLEFLYAIAIEKLSLKTVHIKQLITLIREKCEKEFVLAFNDYIEYILFELPALKKQEWEEELKTGSKMVPVPKSEMF